MHTEHLVERIIHDMNNIIGDDYSTPERAKAQCARAVQRIMERWNYKTEVKVAWLYYQGDLDNYDINFPDLCCDHFAVIVDSEIIIDYTLNQFFPQYPSPAVLDYEEWLNLFMNLWGVEPFFDMDNFICRCGFGVFDGVACEHNTDENDDSEENSENLIPVLF